MVANDKDIKRYTSVDSLGLLDFDQVTDKFPCDENDLDHSSLLLHSHKNIGPKIKSSFLARHPLQHQKTMSRSKLNPDYQHSQTELLSSDLATDNSNKQDEVDDCTTFTQFQFTANNSNNEASVSDAPTQTQTTTTTVNNNNQDQSGNVATDNINGLFSKDINNNNINDRQHTVNISANEIYSQSSTAMHKPPPPSSVSAINLEGISNTAFPTPTTTIANTADVKMTTPMSHSFLENMNSFIPNSPSGSRDAFSSLLSHFPEPPANIISASSSQEAYSDDLMLVTPDGLIDQDEMRVIRELTSEVQDAYTSAISSSLSLSAPRSTATATPATTIRRERYRRHTVTSSNASDGMMRPPTSRPISPIIGDSMLANGSRGRLRRFSGSQNGSISSASASIRGRARADSLVDRARSILDTPRTNRPDPLLENRRRLSIDSDDILSSQMPPESPFFGRESGDQVNHQIGKILDQFDHLEKEQRRLSGSQTWSERRLRSLIHSSENNGSIAGGSGSVSSNNSSGYSTPLSIGQRFATINNGGVRSTSGFSAKRRGHTEPGFSHGSSTHASQIFNNSLLEIDTLQSLENELPPDNLFFTNTKGKTRPSVENIFRASNRAKTLRLGIKDASPNDLMPKDSFDDLKGNPTKGLDIRFGDEDSLDKSDDLPEIIPPGTSAEDNTRQLTLTPQPQHPEPLPKEQNPKELPALLFFFKIDIYSLISGRYRLSKDSIRIKQIMFSKNSSYPTIENIEFDNMRLQIALKSFPPILRVLSKAYNGTSSNHGKRRSSTMPSRIKPPSQSRSAFRPVPLMHLSNPSLSFMICSWQFERDNFIRSIDVIKMIESYHADIEIPSFDFNISVLADLGEEDSELLCNVDDTVERRLREFDEIVNTPPRNAPLRQLTPKSSMLPLLTENFRLPKLQRSVSEQSVLNPQSYVKTSAENSDGHYVVNDSGGLNGITSSTLATLKGSNIGPSLSLQSTTQYGGGSSYISEREKGALIPMRPSSSSGETKLKPPTSLLLDNFGSTSAKRVTFPDTSKNTINAFSSTQTNIISPAPKSATRPTRPGLLKNWSYSSVTTIKRGTNDNNRITTPEYGGVYSNNNGTSAGPPSGRKLRQATSVSFLKGPSSSSSYKIGFGDSGLQKPNIPHVRRNSEYTRLTSPYENSGNSDDVQQHRSQQPPLPPLVPMSQSATWNGMSSAKHSLATPLSATQRAAPKSPLFITTDGPQISRKAATITSASGLVKPTPRAKLTRRPLSDQPKRLASPLSRDISPANSPIDSSSSSTLVSRSALPSPQSITSGGGGKLTNTVPGSIISRHRTLKSSGIGSNNPARYSNSTMSSLDSSEGSGQFVTDLRAGHISVNSVSITTTYNNMNKPGGIKAGGRKSFPMALKSSHVTETASVDPCNSPNGINPKPLNSSNNLQPTGLLRPTKSTIFRTKIANTLRSMKGGNSNAEKSKAKNSSGTNTPSRSSSIFSSVIGRHKHNVVSPNSTSNTKSPAHASHPPTSMVSRQTNGAANSKGDSKVCSPTNSGTGGYPKMPVAAKVGLSAKSSMSSIPRLSRMKSTNIPRPISNSAWGPPSLRKIESVSSLSSKQSSQFSSLAPRSPMYRKALVQNSNVSREKFPLSATSSRFNFNNDSDVDDCLMLRPVETPDIVPRTFTPSELDRAMTPTLKTVYTSSGEMSSVVNLAPNVDTISSLIMAPAPAALSPINTWIANAAWETAIAQANSLDTIPGSPAVSSGNSIKPILKRTPLHSADLPSAGGTSISSSGDIAQLVSLYEKGISAEEYDTNEFNNLLDAVSPKNGPQLFLSGNTSEDGANILIDEMSVPGPTNTNSLTSPAIAQMTLDKWSDINDSGVTAGPAENLDTESIDYTPNGQFSVAEKLAPHESHISIHSNETVESISRPQESSTLSINSQNSEVSSRGVDIADDNASSIDDINIRSIDLIKSESLNSEDYRIVDSHNVSITGIKWDRMLEALPESASEETPPSSPELQAISDGREGQVRDQEQQSSRSVSPALSALIMGYEDDEMFQNPLLSHSKSVSHMYVGNHHHSIDESRNIDFTALHESYYDMAKRATLTTQINEDDYFAHRPLTRGQFSYLSPPSSPEESPKLSFLKIRKSKSSGGGYRRASISVAKPSVQNGSHSSWKSRAMALISGHGANSGDSKDHYHTSPSLVRKNTKTKINKDSIRTIMGPQPDYQAMVQEAAASGSQALLSDSPHRHHDVRQSHDYSPPHSTSNNADNPNGSNSNLKTKLASKLRRASMSSSWLKNSLSDLRLSRDSSDKSSSTGGSTSMSNIHHRHQSSMSKRVSLGRSNSSLFKSPKMSSEATTLGNHSDSATPHQNNISQKLSSTSSSMALSRQSSNGHNLVMMDSSKTSLESLPKASPLANVKQPGPLAMSSPLSLSRNRYSKNGPVTLLNHKNFKKAVDSTNLPVFVKFFAPWCGHCQKFEPEYIKAATKGKGLAKYFAVDCDKQTNQPLCQKYQVQGFPTVKILLPNKGKSNPGAEKEVIDYTGPRTASGLITQAKYYLPNFVKTVSSKKSSNVDKALAKIFKKGNDKIVGILFTEKKDTSLLWKKLAAVVNRKATLYTITSDQTELVAHFKVDQFPKIVMLPPNGDLESKKVYEGPTKYDDIFAFIKEYTAINFTPDKPHDEL
ncbi:hypothetical protein H4219_003811 [Mycoemilia scoparia]|uniref:Thioredoxin domain-containing protein n=1 Tax=Mycoemilia scoparia TaxID=417184 RepID=A0A9W7ZZF8_9FUNG|nr:hypothetical protein H4219_003811 [Mycoemilia scoparia]